MVNNLTVNNFQISKLSSMRLKRNAIQSDAAHFADTIGWHWDSKLRAWLKCSK